MFVATSSTIMPSPLPVATSLSYSEHNSHAFPLPVATSLPFGTQFPGLPLRVKCPKNENDYIISGSIVWPCGFQNVVV